MEVKYKIYLILLFGSLFGALSVIPYQLSLLGLDILSIPLYLIIISALVQTAIIFGVAIFLGLILSKKIGLGLPILEGWLEGRDVKDELKSIIGISVGLGVLAGILIISFDYVFSLFGPVLPDGNNILPAAWQGLLASFYGAINEEILLRLFLMSLLVYITLKIRSTPEGRPTNTGVWVSIILAALIFGAGHLPTLMALGPLTPLVVVRTLLLNALGGIIWGWLYWKKGLESAMISHFSADLILHVFLPLLLTTF